MNTTDEINRVFRMIVEDSPELSALFRRASSMRGPKGELIEFDLKRGQNSYRYLEGPRGEMFCWTPWKSTLGWYYAYTMQPYGKGSQSGNPIRWRARKIVRYRKRKLANRTAIKRYIKAGGKHAEAWQNWMDA